MTDIIIVSQSRIVCHTIFFTEIPRRLPIRMVCSYFSSTTALAKQSSSILDTVALVKKKLITNEDVRLQR